VLFVFGVSHKTAPLEEREALAFPRETMGETLLRLRAEAGLQEVMILSTCNRVEIYAHAGQDAGAPDSVAAFVSAFHHRSPQDLARLTYCLTDAEAVRHAFRVAASLDSMVVGEPQILGQVKEGYRAAEEAGTLGSALNALRNRTLAAAKRARSETGLGAGAVSVSHVAVELARKIFGELRDKNVLLVGAGKMSELAARRLVEGGARATVVVGRTLERAAELAAALGGRAAPLDTLREELAVADIVISGTGAPGTVVKVPDVEAARATRRGRPLFLIDIAVPRDIEPQVAKLPGVFLYDLDDLHAVSEANLRERRKEAMAAETLVEKEAREFLDWQKSRDAVPLLVELRRRGDEIRRQEIEKVRSRLGPLTREQEEALESATAAIVNKLLHAPTVALKDAARNGHEPEQVSLIRRLLGL
jgi:glutamyl-tRNA reductase